VTSPNPTPDSAATVLAKDVVEFELRGPYQWNGGSVTMRLHEGRLDGEPIYFVRTDASDEAFANEVGLVFVPVLRVALAKEGGAGRIFLFGDDAAEGQVSVLNTGPGREDFTPLYRVNRVTFIGEPSVLGSAAAVDAALAAGSIEVEETDVVVNYPAVKWPGDELPVDTVVEKPLEGWPLLGAPDLDAMVVTFKLHQCFPESRYIVTDTSAVPMAPMMNHRGLARDDRPRRGRRGEHDHRLWQRPQRPGRDGLPARHLPREGRAAVVEPAVGSPHGGLDGRDEGHPPQESG
jgi:hypothetical protein